MYAKLHEDISRGIELKLLTEDEFIQRIEDKVKKGYYIHFLRDKLGMKEFYFYEFYNPTNTYSMNIKVDHILPAKDFFSQLTSQVKLFDPYKFAHHTNFLLLTGRPSNQERLILSLLRKKGFRIGEAYFSNYHFNISSLESLTTESDFLIKYWSAKVNLINKIQKSNKYNSITIIEFQFMFKL